MPRPRSEHAIYDVSVSSNSEEGYDLKAEEHPDDESQSNRQYALQWHQGKNTVVQCFTIFLSLVLRSMVFILSPSRDHGPCLGHLGSKARIFVYRQAHRLVPSSGVFTHDLGVALLDRFDEVGQESYLDEAISLFRKSLQIRPSDAVCMNNLGNALRKKSWTRPGNGELLDEAIAFLEQALKLRPSNHRYKVNLAMALTVRFNQGGEGWRRYQASDFDEAVSLLRQTLELPLPPSQHEGRWWCLYELAHTFKCRFLQEDSAADLKEAISLLREVVEICPRAKKVVCLNELADCLYIRAEERIGGVDDLDEAISLYRQALGLSHLPIFERHDTIGRLAHALRERYQHAADESDLTESIHLFRRVLDLHPFPHPRRSEALHSLAFALSIQFLSSRQEDVLDEVVLRCKQAIQLQKPTDPRRPYTLIKLAESLIRGVELMGKDSIHLEEAMTAFSESMDCTAITPSMRLELAFDLSKTLRWACLGKEKPNVYTAATMRIYDAMLQLFPQVASLELDVRSRQRALAKVKIPFSRAAAARAATDYYNNPGKVIEILEAGRNVFWAQALSLRPPLHQVEIVAPDLADRLRMLSSELEKGSYVQGRVDHLSPDLMTSRTSNFSHLQSQWNETVKEIRNIDGLHNFLRQPDFSVLQAAASMYPIVFLFEDPDTLLCVCLIMTSTTVHKFLLKRFGFKLPLDSLVQLLRAAVSDSLVTRSQDDGLWRIIQEHPLRGMRPRRTEVPSSDGILRYILGLLWETVVEPVVDCLGLKKSEKPPLLKWCPIGLFSFLPLHAAGRYEGDKLVEDASEYFVSSYIPNVGVLLSLSPSPPPDQFKMMAVIQSAGLSATMQELESIRRHVPGDNLVELGVADAQATVEAVASGLPNASVVHFACHGKQNSSRPLESGLVMEDGLLTISRIMRENVRNGSLAFLCACETAMGDANLPDEAMSLGASLLFSGFKGVIATMWEIWDQDGPVIADAFYKELFTGPEGKFAHRPDTTRSALALHIAVKELRSKNVSPRRWVPFIHLG